MPLLYTLILSAVIMLAILMFVLWAIARKIDNYALVDVGWSYSFALVAVLFLVLSGEYGPRHLLTAGLVCLWSLRLGTHLFVNRIKGKEEEGRYKNLRAKWKTDLPKKFLIFYMAQAVSVVFLATPFILVFTSPNSAIGSFEIAAIVVGIISISGESIADHQLQTFLKNPNNKGKVCKVGLWRYSRHPNYFFESLIWLAFALLALASPYGWLGFISPMIIWYLITNVTGIPPTEEQSLRSKGDAYRAYQSETSAFFPMPPRSAPS